MCGADWTAEEFIAGEACVEVDARLLFLLTAPEDGDGW